MPAEAHWKIYYMDDTEILWSDISPVGDPWDIPDNKRMGVHSVVQEIDDFKVREPIEQYHYVFQASTMRWIGLGIDGFIDWTAHLFKDIRCILHGRTMATDTTFWTKKQYIRTDPDLCGAVTVEEAEQSRGEAFGINGTTISEFSNPDKQYYTNVARHRMYDERFMEEPIYGHQEHYHH